MMKPTQITKKITALPASKEIVFMCKEHGRQVYETYQQNDGTWREPYCPVCRNKQLEREERIESMRLGNALRAKELRQMFNTQLPLDWEFVSFDTYVPETDEERKTLSVCRRFAERFVDREIEREKAYDKQQQGWQTINSIGLFLQGNYGSGKTHLAYSILKVLNDQGMTGFYITIPELFDKFSDRVNLLDVPKALAKLTMVTCLVLDEIGVQSGSENEKKRLFQIIDGRIKNGRPTILISNLDKGELNALLTERVISRIKASVYELQFNGRSRRGEVTKTQVEELF